MKPGRTLGDWLCLAEGRLRQSGAACGQTASDPHDEALYLMLRILGLPLESPAAVLRRKPGARQRASLAAAFRRRIEGREPSAYITGEAWLGGLRFIVDKRVLIPRSHLAEVIAGLGGRPKRIADVGTGSGCLAILLARRFPEAKVDAIDVSAGALEVAKANIRAHRLSKRVRPILSDVFDAVPAGTYDLIVSNPPYEPSSRCARLPKEFRREPRLALDGGKDGMTIVRKLIAQAAGRLNRGGRLIMEAGGLRKAIDREFGALRPEWLPTWDGSDCVVMFRPAYLARS